MEVAAPVYRHKHISKMKDERHFDKDDSVLVSYKTGDEDFSVGLFHQVSASCVVLCLPQPLFVDRWIGILTFWQVIETIDLAYVDDCAYS